MDLAFYQLQRGQHQILAQGLIASFPLRRVAVDLAEKLLEVLILLRFVEQGIGSARKQAAGRQLRQAQVSNALRTPERLAGMLRSIHYVFKAARSTIRTIIVGNSYQ